MPPTIDLADLLHAAIVVKVPLRMRFRGITERTAVLLCGPAGWGEFAPFPEYPPAEAARWLESAVEAAFLGWPEPVRERVGVNAIVPAVPPAAAAEMAANAWARGARTVKVKVAEPGGSLDQDASRLAAVRESFGRGALRIDANGAWTPDEAVAAIARLDRVAGGLQFVEQPCAELTELARVRQRTSVRIAVDESIRRAADPIRAVRAGAADVLVVKGPPLGGVRAALAVIAEADVPVVVSGAMDTSIGLMVGVALAAAVPQLDLDCGLGTGALLADDVTAATLLADDGGLEVVRSARGTIVGQVPDRQATVRALARVTDVERVAWLQRISLAWQAGAATRIRDLVAHSKA